jgi:hypothetical protein
MRELSARAINVCEYTNYLSSLTGTAQGREIHVAFTSRPKYQQVGSAGWLDVRQTASGPDRIHFLQPAGSDGLPLVHSAKPCSRCCCCSSSCSSARNCTPSANCSCPTSCTGLPAAAAAAAVAGTRIGVKGPLKRILLYRVKLYVQCRQLNSTSF